MTVCERCPDDGELVALIAGRLSDTESERLTKSLDHCGKCQQRILKLTATPLLSSKLPGLKQRRKESPLLSDAVRRIKSMQKTVVGTIPLDQDDSFHIEMTEFVEDGFEILSTIGRGGMGIVFLAKEKSLDRLVAIKVLSPLLGGNQAARQRFLNEARSAASVIHRHIVTIHAVSAKHKTPYLVMEYVEGSTLQDQLDNDGPIAIEEVVRMGLQLCSALSAAHQKGVIHRDIKPSNIMVQSESNDVLLADFGLASTTGLSGLTRTGTVVGTPAFVAPETLDSETRADERSDLFSLGVVLYALCTGDSPFQSDSMLGTLHRIASCNPKSLSESAPQVSANLSQLVMRLLNKNPDERYESADEVASALRACLSPSSAIPNTKPEVDKPPIANMADPSAFQIETVQRSKRRSTRKRRKSNPWQPFIIAGSLLGLTAVFALALVFKTGSGKDLVSQTVEDVPTQEVVSAPRPVDAIPMNLSGTPDTTSLKPLFGVFDEDRRPKGRFVSLEQVFDQIDEGDTIEIASNDVIDVDSEIIEVDDLTIAAAEGFYPVVRFQHDSPEEEICLGIHGTLTLNGLRIETQEEEQFEGLHTLISIFDTASLTLRDCQINASGADFGILVESNANLAIENSHIHAPGSTVIGILDEDTGQTEILDSWLTGEVAFNLLPSTSHHLQLVNSQCVVEWGFRIEREDFFLDDEEDLDDDDDLDTHVNDAEEDVDPNDAIVLWTIQFRDSILMVTGGLLEDGPDALDASSTFARLEFDSRNGTIAGQPFGEETKDLWEAELELQSLQYTENPFREDIERIDDLIHFADVPEFELIEQDDES
ncbi:MAG: serine/threonine-protein kinase [Planctomycetota bacterium]